MKKPKPRTIAALWTILDAARGSTKPKPATSAALAKLRRASADIHPSIFESLAVHDGDVALDSYTLLSAKQIADRHPPHLLYFGNVPFAMDGGGNYYTVNKQGKVLGIDRGDRSHFVKAQSIAAWFEELVKGLTKGTLEATPEGWIIEKEVVPSVPHQEDETERIEEPFATEVTAHIEAGEVAALKKLLDAGTVKATAHLWTGATLINVAASASQLGVVKLLVARGCPVDHGVKTGKRTALFMACWGPGRPEIFDYTLAQGADPNAQTSFDGTPLHAAIMFDNAELAKRLIAAGADPERTTADGVTARALAKKHGVDLGAAAAAPSPRKRAK